MYYTSFIYTAVFIPWRAHLLGKSVTACDDELVTCLLVVSIALYRLLLLFEPDITYTLYVIQVVGHRNTLIAADQWMSQSTQVIDIVTFSYHT